VNDQPLSRARVLLMFFGSKCGVALVYYERTREKGLVSKTAMAGM
jgi:hypothetical protein